jgi:membrane protease subunit (stomatin/prohibitin family)
MSLSRFLQEQFVEVIQRNEPDEALLAYRYPIADMEIRNGAQLTVRESQAAAFVNEGKIADIFGPGLYTLNTHNLPLLTDLKNWDKDFESPFKSDVYFFSLRLQIDQRWGTATPITIREKEFGAVRLRAYGIYSYRIADPRKFFTNVSGTRKVYRVEDLEGQLRNTIIARLTEVVAPAEVAFLDMAAHQAELAEKVAAAAQPSFATLGLELVSFVIESLSLPDELQKVLDERIGMNLAGDMARYTQFEAARSLEQAAENPGGPAGVGAGLGVGLSMAQTIMNSVQRPARPAAGAKFCPECGKEVAGAAKFCPECGTPQARK